MGKYDKVIGGLPKDEPEDSKYQEKIQEAKDKLVSMTTFTPEVLAQMYFDSRTEHDRIEQERYENQIIVTALEQMLIESSNNDEPGWGMYGAKPNQIKLRNGASIFVYVEPKGKVVDREAFRLWCINNGLAERLMLWPSQMNAIVKEKLLAGETAPEGTQAVVVDKITLRRPGRGDKE